MILRTVTVLSALLMLTSFLPMAEAQGGQGQRAVLIEILSPEKAKTNKTLDIVNGTTGDVKIRVGYRASGGGGGGMMGGGFIRVCQSGTEMNIKLKVEPADIPGAHVMITPATFKYDIATRPPAVPPSQPGHVWREGTLTIHYEGNVSTPTSVPFVLTHDAGTVSGPGCQPSAPTTGNPAQNVKLPLNLTLPYTPPAIKPKAAPKEEGLLPGPGFMVMMLGLALVLALGRRRLE